MDRDDDNVPDNLIPFPRIGFAPPPATTTPPFTDSACTPETEPADATAGEGDGGAWGLSLPGRPRRSPLDAVSELREPGLAPPPVIDDDLAAPLMRDDGQVPDTFRPDSDGAQHDPAYGQHLGALSLAAALAVVVAALRGIHTLVQARRASREQQRAVDRVASSGSGGGRGSGGRVQSGPEHGRSVLNRRNNSSSGGGRGGSGRGNGGGGSNRSNRSTDRSGSRSPGADRNRRPNPGGGKDKPARDKNGPGRSLLGKDRPGSKKDRDTGTAKTDRKSKGPGVHRTSQGGTSKVLDRARRKLDKRAEADSPAKKKNRPGGRHDAAGGRGGRGPGKAKDRGKKPGPLSPWTKDTKGKDLPGGKATKAKAGDKHAGKTSAKDRSKDKAGRTTLSDAITKEARRRMKRRRRSMTPPLWSARKGHKNTGPKKTTSDTTTDKTRPSTTTGSKTGSKTGRAGGYWGKAQARARSYWQRRHYTHTTTTGPAAAPGGGTGWEFAGAGAGSGAAGGPGGPGAGSWRRRSPWEAAGMATGTTGDTTVILERLDNVGDAERPYTPPPVPAGDLDTPPAQVRGALGPAPIKNFPRPGTTRPRPMPYTPARGAGMKENRMSALNPLTATGRRQVPGMDAQHETEVTLDDVCDLLQELTAESFDTHDKCADLARRARALQARLLDLAEDLAVNHNVIGDLTSAAMSRLAEDMDVLARQAEEMSAQSLHAAEATETADNAMNDAYRPITQAAADAGLLAPSAPVHNQS